MSSSTVVACRAIGPHREWANVTVELRRYGATAYETGNSAELSLTNSTLVLNSTPNWRPLSTSVPFFLLTIRARMHPVAAGAR